MIARMHARHAELQHLLLPSRVRAMGMAAGWCDATCEKLPARRTCTHAAKYAAECSFKQLQPASIRIQPCDTRPRVDACVDACMR